MKDFFFHLGGIRRDMRWVNIHSLFVLKLWLLSLQSPERLWRKKPLSFIKNPHWNSLNLIIIQDGYLCLKSERSVIIYIVIIESKYRLYSVKYLIFHYNKRRCVHILLDGRLKGKQINYLLPSSPLTLKAPTPNCCAPSATVFHAKTTARLLDIFSVLMYQHIKRVNHKKETAFQCYTVIWFYSNFQFF